MDNKSLEKDNDIIIYTTDDGQVEIEVKLEDEKVLTIMQEMKNKGIF